MCNHKNYFIANIHVTKSRNRSLEATRWWIRGSNHHETFREKVLEQGQALWRWVTVKKALKFSYKQRFGKSLTFGERNRQSEKRTQPSYRGITIVGGAEINSKTSEKFFLEHSLLRATALCRTIASTDRSPPICRVHPYCVFLSPFHAISHRAVSATHVKKSKLGSQNCEILGTFRKSHSLISWAQFTEPAWLGGQDWTKSSASSPWWKPAWVPAGKHFMRTLEEKL